MRLMEEISVLHVSYVHEYIAVCHKFNVRNQQYILNMVS